MEYATRDQYEIPRSQISLTKKLGAGNFGEVWKGMKPLSEGTKLITMSIFIPNNQKPDSSEYQAFTCLVFD